MSRWEKKGKVWGETQKTEKMGKEREDEELKEKEEMKTKRLNR